MRNARIGSRRAPFPLLPLRVAPLRGRAPPLLSAFEVRSTEHQPSIPACTHRHPARHAHTHRHRGAQGHHACGSAGKARVRHPRSRTHAATHARAHAAHRRTQRATRTHTCGSLYCARLRMACALEHVGAHAVLARGQTVTYTSPLCYSAQGTQFLRLGTKRERALLPTLSQRPSRSPVPPHRGTYLHLHLRTPAQTYVSPQRPTYPERHLRGTAPHTWTQKRMHASLHPYTEARSDASTEEHHKHSASKELRSGSRKSGALTRGHESRHMYAAHPPASVVVRPTLYGVEVGLPTTHRRTST